MNKVDMLEQKEDPKSQMVRDACVIIASVNFLEKQIQKKISLFEEALNNGFDEEAELIEKQIKSLLLKINKENGEMDRFMLKYKNRENNEKETILSGIK